MVRLSPDRFLNKLCLLDDLGYENVSDVDFQTLGRIGKSIEYMTLK